MPRRQEHLVEPCPKCGKDIGFVYPSRWSRPDSKTYQGRPYKEKVKKRYPYENRPIPRENEFSKAIEKPIVLLESVRYFLPKLLNRHSELKQNLEYYTRGMQVQAKQISPLTDNRTIHHWQDWFNIIMLADEGGYRRASRKYGVSVIHIKNKKEEVKRFAKEVGEYGLGCLDFFMELVKIWIMIRR